jgi:DNA helicase II / ATP-dependent DNA helicase PcrA
MSDDAAALTRLIEAWSRSDRVRSHPAWPMLAVLPDLICFLEARADPTSRRVLEYLFSGIDLRPEIVFGLAGYEDDLYLISRHLADCLDAPESLRKVAQRHLSDLADRLRGDPSDFRSELDRLFARYQSPMRSLEVERARPPIPFESSDPNRAIEHVDGPMIVFAGPGTGKTFVIERRVRHLIEAAGVAPERIAVVTFTNAAADELARRIGRSLAHRPDADDVLSRLRIGTIHSFCNALIQQHQHRVLFLRGTFTPVESRRQILFLFREGSRIGTADLYRDWRIVSEERGAPRWRLTWYDFLAEIADVFNFVSEEVLGASPAAQVRYHEILLGEGSDVESRMIRCYPAYWRAMTEAGFIDQSMILSYAEALLRDPEVLRAVRAETEHVLVDEYQDTNPIQDRIVRRIAGPDGNLFVVGDDDQAIYRFRGAEVDNILGFSQRMHGTARVRLETNRRSTGALVAAASTLIANNGTRVNKDLRSVHDHGRPPVLVALPEADHRAEWVARRIAALALGGTKIRYSDCAILFRSVRASSAPFTKALERAGIPHRIGGGHDLFKSDFVRSLLDLIRQLVAESSLVDRTVHPSALEQFYELLWQSGWLSNHEADDHAMIQIARLTTLISEFEERGIGRDAGTCLREFLEYVAAVRHRVEIETNQGEDAVLLTTVHGAKGLEFGHVFLPDLDSDRIPMIVPERARERLRTIFDEQGDSARARIEEERRVLYVAMTRAASNLYLLTDPRKPSPFVAEVSGSCTTNLDPSEVILREPRNTSQRSGLRLSHSDLQDYEYCPQRYRLARTHGFAPVSGKATFAGRSLHRALEVFHRTLADSRQIRSEDLDRMFDRSWTRRSGDVAREREQCRIVFKNYGRSMLEDPTVSIVAVERPIIVSKDENTLLGKIDLVQQRAGALEVVDFKYRRNAELESSARNQLDRYSLAFPGQDIRLILHYLLDDERDEHEKREPALVWDAMRESFEGIRRAKFGPNPDAKRCEKCPMRHACASRAG